MAWRQGARRLGKGLAQIAGLQDRPFMLALDAVLIVLSVLLMVTTSMTVVAFHFVFLALAFGAFFWDFRALLIRTVVYVGLASVAVASAVAADRTQSEELVEIPLMTAIIWIVFLIARGRTKAEEQASRSNARLALKLQELDTANLVLKEARTALEHSNAALEEFASIASHDLQEPLRKVRIFSERLRTAAHAELGPSGRDYADRIDQTAQRMQLLITDLLRYSKPEGHERPFESVALESVVRLVLGDLEAIIEESGAEVEIGPLPTIEAIPIQMRQLFQNLIANSIKFRSEHGTPTVRIYQEESPVEDSLSNARLVVQDNGIGFEQKYADPIFGLFERLHGRRFEGSGVGLAICAKLVEHHGGKIAAEGTPGVGAKFTVDLPIHHTKSGPAG